MDTIFSGEDKDLYINLKKPDGSVLDISATGLDISTVVGSAQFEKASSPTITDRSCTIEDGALGRIKLVVNKTDFASPTKSGYLILWFRMTAVGGKVTDSEEYTVEVVSHPRK